MASKVISELVTKWIYKVDTSQVKKAITDIQRLKKELVSLKGMHNFSAATSSISNLSTQWRAAAISARAYGTAIRKNNVISRGGLGGGRGGGGGGSNVLLGGVGGRRRGRGGRGRGGGFSLTTGGAATLLGTMGAFEAASFISSAIGGALDVDKFEALIKSNATRKGADGAAIIAATKKAILDLPLDTTQVRQAVSLMMQTSLPVSDIFPLLTALTEATISRPDAQAAFDKALVNLVQNIPVGVFKGKQLTEFLTKGLDLIPLIAADRYRVKKGLPQSTVLTKKQQKAAGRAIDLRSNPATFDEVRRAIFRFSKESNNLEVAMNTTWGEAQRLTERFQLLREEMGKVLVPEFIKSFTSLMDGLEKNKDTLIAVFTGLANVAADFRFLAGGIGTGFKWLGEIATAARVWLGLSPETGDKILNFFLAALAWINPYIRFLKVAQEIGQVIRTGVFGVMLDSIRNFFVGIMEMVKYVLESTELMGFGNFQFMRDAAEAIGTAIDHMNRLGKLPIDRLPRNTGIPLGILGGNQIANVTMYNTYNITMGKDDNLPDTLGDISKATKLTSTLYLTSIYSA